LSERGHDLTRSAVLDLQAPRSTISQADLHQLGNCILSTRAKGRPVGVFLGGHPFKLGLQRFLIDLLDRRLVSHLATNGSGLIHDFELALAGGTSEDVARWLSAGQFGLWQETSRLNEVVRHAAARREGLGEAAGRVIEEERFPHRDLSVAAACWRAGIPFTSHVTIGADIIHSHPNCDGAALGQASYTDFLIFARTIQDLEGGVFLNIGSAVTGPEVFLKALSMARNIAHQEGRHVKHFTTAVFDLAPLPENWRDARPGKDEHWYYYRPWKTLLLRTVADGAQSYYIRGDHRQTIPTLWRLVTQARCSGVLLGASQRNRTAQADQFGRPWKGLPRPLRWRHCQRVPPQPLRSWQSIRRRGCM
jgi:hypothetical protein